MIATKERSTLRMVDLYCGCGGVSCGAVEAVKKRGIDLTTVGVNHWERAIETISLNIPGRHVLAAVEAVNPDSLAKRGEVDVLWGSPSCVFHSLAAGGRPIDDQLRASPFAMLHMAECWNPPLVLIENVPNFPNWGPVNRYGKPIKSKRRQTYNAYINMWDAMGYIPETTVECCANFGDPTSRERFFLALRRPHVKWEWPKHTHADPKLGLDLPAWRTAREIIDLSNKGRSVFGRKIAKNTWRRIFHGLREHGGEQFVIRQQGQSNTMALDQPLSTICASTQHHYLCTPFLVKYNGTAMSNSIDDPLDTITAGGHKFALIQPFLIKYYGTANTIGLDVPLDTVTTKDRFALVQPVLKSEGGDNYKLDICMRVLTPNEYKQAHSFPESYTLTGGIKEQVKQIGNSVPVKTAEAMVGAAIKALNL